jgi:large repetitive protein
MSFKSYSRWLTSRILKKSQSTLRSKIGIETLEERSVPAIINITPNPLGIQPLEGAPTGTATQIGTFTVDNYIGINQASQLSAEVVWGDGIVSGASAPTSLQFGAALGAGQASYNVFASHIYTTASLPGNPYTLTLRVFDNTTVQGTTQSASTFVTVRDNPLTAQTNPTITATVGSPLTNVVVARFTDANPYSNADQLRATITWSNPTRTQAGIIVRDFNGVYSVLGSHTYDQSAGAGPSTITVNVVSQDPALGITINNSATVSQAAIVPSAAPITIAEGATTIPANTTVGTFTDLSGGQAAAIYQNAGTFAIFPGSLSGTTPLTVTRNGTTNTYSLTTTSATTITAARIGNYPYSVQVLDNTGVLGRSTGTLTVNNAPITIIAVSAVTAPTEGQPTTVNPILTFTDANLSANSSEYLAEINWGDDTPDSVGVVTQVGAGQFTVSGTHTFTRRSGTATRRITVSITDSGGQTVSASTGTFFVLDALLSNGVGIPVVGAAGQSLVNVPVATFVDANPFAIASDYTASINWGVGSPVAPPASVGTVTLVGRSAAGTVFSVSGSTVYPSVTGSPYTLQVTITDIGGQVLNPTTTATITQSPIAVSVYAQNGSAGLALTPTSPFALFTDSNGASPANAYTATINWGDGSTPVTLGAGVGITLVSGNQLRFTPPAGFTYARPGLYPINVTIAGPDGRVGVGSASALIGAPAFSNVAGIFLGINATEGLPLPTTTQLASFTVANPSATPAGYTATIDWGDGSPLSLGTIVANGTTATTASFQVTAGHTYTRYTGVPFNIRINISDAFGTTVTTTTVVNQVADAALTAGAGIPIVGAAGQLLVNVPLGTFSDANPFAREADHTVTINWGDGSPVTTGFVTLVGRNATSSVFAISGTKTYTSVAGSPYNITAQVTDAGGSTTTVTTQATITQSPLAVAVNTQNGSAGLPVVPTVPFALFTDSNGAAAPGAYTATINWGDGSVPVTLAAGAGISLVSGNQLRFIAPPGFTYARPGLYPVTVTIAGPDGRVGIGAASALITAPVFSGVAGGPNITTAVEGTALPATTPVAVFTVNNPSATAGGYTATIDWGDGSPTSIGVITATGTTATTASFRVTAPHTYTRYNAGPLTIRVNISDAFGTTVNATTTVTIVADAALSGAAPVAILGSAGQLLSNVLVGTFVDANPFATEADHAVTINWGDGGPTTVGLVSLVGRNGTSSVFAVTGSRTYASVVGTPFAVSAVVTDAGGSTVTINTTATITQSPLTVSVNAQNGAVGTPFVPTTPLALFTDANGAAAPGAYTATVNWGDGSAPVTFAAGAGIALVSGNQLRFNAPAGHNYTQPGIYSISVTIAGPDGRVGVGSASVLIVPPAISGVAGGPNVTTAVEGTALPATTRVAVFTIADPAAVASGYTATIDWGDGSPNSIGVISSTGTTATTTTFQVTGGHTYTRYNAGPVTIRVNIANAFGTTVSTTTTVTVVADAALSGPVGVPVVGAAGQLLSNVLIGTFVDANPFATEADHAVTINWGDGGPTTVGIVSLVGRSGTGSVFSISGSRTYGSVVGTPFAITAVVTDAGGSTVTVTTTATITQSPIAVSVYAQSGSAGLPIVPTVPFALFTDSNGAAAPAAYTATISWGDGSAPVTLAAGAGITLVSGNQLRFTSPVTYTYARPGLYPITVTIAGPDGRVGVGASSTLIAAPVFSGLSGGPNITTAVEGTALPTTTQVAVFTINNPSATAAGYTAVIDWGDGSPFSLGTVSLTGTTATTASFQVTGGHTYTRYNGGPITIRVNISDAFGTTVSTTTTVTQVADAALSGPVGVPVVGAAGQLLSNVLIGTFVDANPFATEADHAVTINWGDGGPTTVGIVSLVGRNGTSSVFSISGSRTYASVVGTPFTITAVVTDAGASTVTVTTTATITQSPIAVAVYAQNGSAGLAVVPSVPFALFTDSNGAAAPAAYTATINWGDGSAPQVLGAGVGITLVSGNQLRFTAPAAGYTYARPGLYPITVTIAGPDGRVGVGASSALIAAPVFSGVAGGPNITTAVEGTALPAATQVAVFTVNNPSATAGGYTATIDWGDGSPTSIGVITATGTTATTASFQVTGAHTYSSYNAGPVTIRVNISDAFGTTVNATTTVTRVADALLSGPAGIPIVGAAGQLLVDVPLGTFVDANPLATEADHSVTINWGDGSPLTTGLVSLVGRSATSSVFAIRGTKAYASVVGTPFTITAVVTDAGGSTVTVTTTATITQSPIAVSVYAQNGSAGLPIVPTVPFALFTDSNGASPATAYTATINWGDGSAPVTFAAGAGIALVSGNQLRFTAPAAYTYARPGLYPVTVTIAGPDGRVGVGASSTLIVPAAYPGGIVAGAAINRVEGSAIPATTVLATFTNANPSAIASGFTATIDWGDGSPFSVGLITATGTTATSTSFQVAGGHTYARPGTYTVTVTIVDEFGGGGVARLTSTVTNATILNPQGIALVGTVRIPLVNVSLGRFTDNNPLGSASEYTATINWNDPQAVGADPIGLVSLVGGVTGGVQFAVAGSHTYSRAGTYPISVLITDTSGQTLTINTSVTVRAPILTGAANPVVATEGQATPANLPTATFSNLGSSVASDYTVTVNWGDGTTANTTATGVSVVSTGNGAFNVLAPVHTYAFRGNYVVTVTVSGIDGSGPVSWSSTATVQDAALTGANGNASINEGAELSASPLVTFVDANLGGTVGEYLATIDWGDGTSGTGKVTQPNGIGTAFQVFGTHTYSDNRAYLGTVVVSSAGGSRAVIPATVNVLNVAPTAQITNTGPVFENSPVTVSLINAFDPSPADTAAGLRYSFSLTQSGLASSYLAAGLSNSAQFTFPDGPSGQNVWARVIDKDGGFTDYVTTVIVTNVAPTATISTNGTLLPRQPVTVTLANVSDPSPVDSGVGFTYSFDTGNGVFTNPSSSPSITFTPTVSGSLTVRGRVIDKDGGFTDYTVGGGPGGLVVRDQTIYAVGAGAGGSPIVKIYSPNGNLISSFFAYDPSFRGGVNVAVGDVTGDGIPDVVTGTGVGGGPHVKVFDGRDYSQVANFMATNPEFRGGIRVAAGDVDGDGKADVVTGAGNGGGPRVQVFRGSDYAMIQNFFAYDSSFRGGVNIAVGDVNGDGLADIITGAGNGGAPHVKVFNGQTRLEIRGFFAYEPTFTGGVTVAVGDIDRDGSVEIVTGPGLGGGARLRSFNATTGESELSVFAFGPDRVNGKPLRNGMQVAITGLNSARGPVVVVGSGPDYAPLVTIRDGRTLDELNTIVPFEDSFAGGVFVG